MLAAKNRQAAGSTAPSLGLYLQWIRFSDAATDATMPDGTSADAADVQPGQFKMKLPEAEQNAGPIASAGPDDARTLDSLS
jgi:hypothetical protein